ncbi:MAG: hypothetical protein Q8922_06895 [Bacteroidota bacterium]|nr:hypothetical protein [Bacteroidota bacterium]
MVITRTLVTLSLASLSFLASISVFPEAAHSQLRPDELTPDSYVKLVMQDSAQFYVVVLGRPLPDRIIAETRYGRLEIPLAAISYAIDYRYNWVQKDDLKREALRTTGDESKYNLARFLNRPKLPDTSTVATRDHNLFKGRRYLFDDSAHVILATGYGNLFFKYPDLEFVENWSGQNDRRDVFQTNTYITSKDPLTSQDFLTPTARAFGSQHIFLMDYLVAGLQLNYGVTDWLSLNGGGLFAPFLPTTISTATAGMKITPYASPLFTLAAGAQGVYSYVTKANRIAFPFLAATYGTWESELTVLGGIGYQSTDSAGIPFTHSNPVVVVAGDMRVGENLKAAIEFAFIGDFGIVPTVFSVRYFENDFTIDVGVVFSLYKGGYHALPTLGEYVFNTTFDVIPLVSGSYHF